MGRLGDSSGTSSLPDRRFRGPDGALCLSAFPDRRFWALAGASCFFCKSAPPAPLCAFCSIISSAFNGQFIFVFLLWQCKGCPVGEKDSMNAFQSPRSMKSLRTRMNVYPGPFLPSLLDRVYCRQNSGGACCMTNWVRAVLRMFGTRPHTGVRDTGRGGTVVGCSECSLPRTPAGGVQS